MLEWFKIGGIWMYPILAIAAALCPLGMPMVAAAALAPPAARRVVGWICIAGILGGLLAAGIGVLGMGVGLAQVNEALRMVDPEHADELRRIGSQEARVPLWFGLGVAAVVVTEMGAALALAWRPAAGAPG